MPRPKQCRSVACPPESKGFRPYGCERLKNRDSLLLRLDEYEAIRLIDYLGLSQDIAAQKMKVSRPTITRVYEKARKTIATALIENQPLEIVESNVEYYGRWHSCTNTNKNEDMKKIAIPTTDGYLFPHFGKASQFTFVTIEDGQVINTEIMIAPPHAHGVAPRFVLEHQTTEVIAGGIGAMPVNMLMEAGVEVHIGAPALPIDEIIAKYLDGSLTFDESNVCNCHHHDKHSCGDHKEYVYTIPAKE